MTSVLGKLCSLLLTEVYGEVVAEVGSELHQWNARTLPQLVNAKKQNSAQKVRQALAVLIHHNIVTFAESERWGMAEYTLHHDKILALLRYPRYLLLCRNLFSNEGEILIEEIYKQGQVCAFKAILATAKKLKASATDDVKTSDIVQNVRTAFAQMAKCQFIARAPTLLEDGSTRRGIPKLELRKETMFLVPEVDIRSLCIAVDADTADEVSSDDKNVLWTVNNDRFHREFRDQVIVQAVSRRIDSSAGNLMRVILNLINEVNPWAAVSTQIHQIDILQRIRNAELTSAVGADGKLQAYLEQYIKVLEEDRIRFIDRVGDAGGGQYVVNVRHIFEELAASTMDNIVLEKFGSKALRIFRVIRQKVHVEESQLQNLVMIPSKETKELTYQLLENNFIQLQELRKSMAANTISKSFYLFYVDMNQVSRMLVELCYKALTNSLVRKSFEANANQRLIDKHERIESIASGIRNSENFAESEEMQLQLQEVQDMLSPVEREAVSKVRAHLDQLSRAAGQVDESLFVIQTFLFYKAS